MSFHRTNVLPFLLLASVALAETSQPPTDKLFSNTPGRAKPIEFTEQSSPLADQNLSAPVSLPKLGDAQRETPQSAFSALTHELKVTNVVLTNDPAYRAVGLNKIPFRQGQKVPDELFSKAPGGEVIVDAIEPDRIVLSLHTKNGDKEATTLTADLQYSFAPTPSKKRKS